MADRVRPENANRLEVVHADCAGIDIGKESHYAGVDPARFDEPVRSFGTVTAELERMAQWLRGCGVRLVAMEATGVYWIPAFGLLERAGRHWSGTTRCRRRSRRAGSASAPSWTPWPGTTRTTRRRTSARARDATGSCGAG